MAGSDGAARVNPVPASVTLVKGAAALPVFCRLKETVARSPASSEPKLKTAPTGCSPVPLTWNN
jgi:hypothetical protein